MTKCVGSLRGRRAPDEGWVVRKLSHYFLRPQQSAYKRGLVGSLHIYLGFYFFASERKRVRGQASHAVGLGCSQTHFFFISVSPYEGGIGISSKNGFSFVHKTDRCCAIR